MISIKLESLAHGQSAFKAYEDGEPVGSMVVLISGDTLKAIHTEVDPAHEGKGIARQLLDAMVAHARENKLRVVPICPYVLAQFRRHPERYADLWIG
ncbi:MAG: GNAT family N-acetyltransferase [Bacteroidota bacterium]|nr:GNAT family N-acetyltransferase [Bacteroidota bacterium]MDP4216782.1 GNAT family N-acetyltransferase [Bacteroidota bacterium]MDP4252638.1 GNAT family N-acetyltransferase [Bacteroidota bacterium]MDP4258503.1 GNAT family N-acetyltransferase [Bacteroidota bacterium]